ncbi:pyrophosphatase [Klebsiella phage YMC16/01/N133_KPN_BP]|uniref:Putative pyrophosphatase n=1 Tax=Klebsiella phage YMC16/01/N133_KPN_BP TaxID=2026102 RepID=A0A248XD87_9CAUD|nr:pyrophosphatase [Klebsiella phage YMC16/01/N133_KPN_BP]ASW27669.1 putative pyrophosphatase [Klebsiella phage YMC16/01/N133_KPN_BP]
MDKNIFELAKKLADLSPLESGAAIRLIREHGYKHGERASAVIDLAKALISVCDGKASTLDQASAWREVWKYLSDAEMVRESGGRSPVQQVLDILGDYRRMSAGATPLNVQTAFPGTRLVQIMDGELPTEAEQVSREFDKDILEIKTSCAAVMARAPKAFTHCESSALIDKLASAVFNLALTVQKSHREFATFAAPVRIINNGCTTDIAALIKANNELASYSAPAQEAEYDPYNAKPCHPSHELYSTGDADAPEQIKDRNGEVVLDQCRHCGRAESQLLDGKPCAVEPANDNTPDPLTDPAAIRRWKDAVDKLADVVEPARLDVVKRLLVLQDVCYGLANNAGWWTDLETGEDVRNWPKKHLDNWVSAKLMLIVTEVAEAMEGHRKGLKDDKIPHRGMLEVELADAVIRIMDLAGGLNMDVAGAIVEKLAYNMSREDHRIENRKAAGGKSV